MCHPSSVDDIFISFVKKIASEFNMDIEINEDYPSGDLCFKSPEFTNFDEIAKQSIAYKRKYWILDFGPETMSLGCAAATNKFVEKFKKK